MGAAAFMYALQLLHVQLHLYAPSYETTLPGNVF